MEDSNGLRNSRPRKLVFKKDTVRVLDAKEAKTVVGGMARTATTHATTTFQSAATGCCKPPTVTKL